MASAEAGDSGVRLTLQPAKGNGAEETMSVDVVLVSTGEWGHAWRHGKPGLKSN